MAVFKRMGGEVKNMGSSFVRRLGENLKKKVAKKHKKVSRGEYNELIYHSFSSNERYIMRKKNKNPRLVAVLHFAQRSGKHHKKLE